MKNTFLITLMCLISYSGFSQTSVDTVEYINEYCVDSNPWAIDTTMFWFRNDSLILRDIERGSSCTNVINVVLQRSNDTIRVSFNRDTNAVMCLDDCSAGYRVNIGLIDVDTIYVVLDGVTHEVILDDLNTVLNDNLNNATVIITNPVSSILDIYTDKTIQELQIIDVKGIVMLSQKYCDNKINVERFNNGIYFVRLIVGGEVILGSFLKE